MSTATTIVEQPPEGWVYIYIPPFERKPHTFTLPGERVSEYLAVTPLWDLKEAGWLGWWTITHIPTGTALHDLQVCVACARAAGKALAALNIDWPALTRDKHVNWALLSERQRQQVSEIVVDATLACASGVCEVATR